jgi:hypothetical protein
MGPIDILFKCMIAFKNEGLALEIFELQAISNDYEINGWGKYTWGQNLKCDFELKYYAYIPAHKEKEGPLYITFRVYGPLEHLGYRITG